MSGKGIGYAIAAYVLWGLLPIYWKLLQAVDPMEILMHRMVWSLVFLVAVLSVYKRWDWLKPVLHERKTLILYGAASLLLATNWGIYIWAVHADYIVETSLGYYITPLINVVMGMLLFKEKLRVGQWVAIGIALCGVLYLTFNYGQFPWIGLVLATSFGIYGVLKKQAPLGAFEGLSLETAVMFVPAVIYIGVLQVNHEGALGQVDMQTHVLLLLAGVATAIPLLFFAAAARRIPLSWIGILQYISPSLAMVLGVLVYNEPFGPARQIGFILIWMALIVFSAENVMYMRRSRP